MRSVGAITPAGKKLPAWGLDETVVVGCGPCAARGRGGGECDLDNLRTLGLCCHREVKAELRLWMRKAKS
jgi:hypothetical protein